MHRLPSSFAKAAGRQLKQGTFWPANSHQLASTTSEAATAAFATVRNSVSSALPELPVQLLPPFARAIFGGNARQILEQAYRDSALRRHVGACTGSLRQRFSLQRLSVEQDLALRRLQGLEMYLVGFTNSFFTTNGGQKALLAGLPLAALQVYRTEAAQCYSGHAEQQRRALRRALEGEHAHTMQRLGQRVGQLADALLEEMWTVVRGVYLFVLFMPVVLTSPICITLGWRRADWLQLLCWTLERAGPAFIKWGQWSATRPDMFPPDLCKALTVLQNGAPRHSFAYTRQAVEAAFDRRLEDIFEHFDERPVASGSIAQVHRAVLSAAGAAGTDYAPGTEVAVKVRHPGVTLLMQQDFTLMQRAAAVSKQLPGLSDLKLDESVRQFGAPLKEQLDLQTEAGNLERFNQNFRRWKNLSFPAPIQPLVAPDVLVETFEGGDLITAYVDAPQNKHNLQLANIGLTSYLKMLLKDNFIHADLHPGNILVRLEEEPRGAWGRLLRRLGLRTPEHLVLLDVGMVAELTPTDQRNLVDFFQAISSQDGRALGHNILKFSDNQTCPDPEAFVGRMTELFEGLTPQQISDKTSDVIADIMEAVRQHQVDLKGIVSTVVVTTLVLEGWSSKLNPDLRILDTLRDILPMSAKDRLIRAVDQFRSSNELVIA